MLKIIKNLIGAITPKNELPISMLEHAPRDLGNEIITPGNPNHSHTFVEASWDRERLGPSFVDPEYSDDQIAFTMATYKYLFRCKCGAEAVQKTRALI